METVEKINSRTNCKAVLYDLADLDQLKKEMDSSYLFVNATARSDARPYLQSY